MVLSIITVPEHFEVNAKQFRQLFRFVVFFFSTKTRPCPAVPSNKSWIRHCIFVTYAEIRIQDLWIWKGSLTCCDCETIKKSYIIYIQE